jgi:hypothetical protein
MRLLWLLVIGMAASGCVHGYGGCLWVSPVKHTLSGRVHYRTYPMESGGVDKVPVLQLDSMAYIYAPAVSVLCQAADELQLVGISEFSETVVENSRVQVRGKIFAAASSRDHTPFLMNVITLLPDNSPQNQTEGRKAP